MLIPILTNAVLESPLHALGLRKYNSKSQNSKTQTRKYKIN